MAYDYKDFTQDIETLRIAYRKPKHASVHQILGLHPDTPLILVEKALRETLLKEGIGKLSQNPPNHDELSGQKRSLEQDIIVT